jgi:iron-sulfur cluster assembly accessory protein
MLKISTLLQIFNLEEDMVSAVRKSVSRKFDLAPEAAKQLRAIMTDEGKQGWVLILNLVQMPCKSEEYILKLAPYHDSDDEVFRFYKIDVCVPHLHLPKLFGSSLQYDAKSRPQFTGLLGNGFFINNPNVKTSCQCGCERGYVF